MKYADWQVERLRDVLRAWHDYHPEFTWKDVMEAIDLKTEVRIPWERLRQFVVGVRKPDGSRSLPVLRGDRLEAVADWAFFENLISADEIKRYDPRLQAPQRLIEFLRGPDPPRFSVRPPRLEGEFTGNHADQDGQVSVRVLSIRVSNSGEIEPTRQITPYLYVVSERREYFDETDYRANGPSAESLAAVEYAGWAVVTLEGSVLFFLQSSSGANEFYISMTQGTPEGQRGVVAALILLSYEDTYYGRQIPNTEEGFVDLLIPSTEEGFVDLLRADATERANPQLVAFVKTQ